MLSEADIKSLFLESTSMAGMTKMKRYAQFDVTIDDRTIMQSETATIWNPA
jgi:hypothetical protein